MRVPYGLIDKIDLVHGIALLLVTAIMARAIKMVVASLLFTGMYCLSYLTRKTKETKATRETRQTREHGLTILSCATKLFNINFLMNS